MTSQYGVQTHFIMRIWYIMITTCLIWQYIQEDAFKIYIFLIYFQNEGFQHYNHKMKDYHHICHYIK
jgi:hypothetical protein